MIARCLYIQAPSLSTALGKVLARQGWCLAASSADDVVLNSLTQPRTCHPPADTLRRTDTEPEDGLFVRLLSSLKSTLNLPYIKPKLLYRSPKSPLKGPLSGSSLVSELTITKCGSVARRASPRARRMAYC